MNILERKYMSGYICNSHMGFNGKLSKPSVPQESKLAKAKNEKSFAQYLKDASCGSKQS